VTEQRLERLSWVDIAAAIDRGALVVLPLGSIEQHGPHLPVDTDAYLAGELARRGIEGLDAVVAPTIHYGYRSRPLSGGGESFPGTLSLSGQTYIAVVHEVLAGLIRHGFRRLLLYQWHMENKNFAYEAAYLAAGDRSDVKIVVMESAFDSLTDETMAAIFPDGFPGWAAEHAATFETSLMLHLRPEAVDMSKAVDDWSEQHPPYDIVPQPASLTTRSGVLANATPATAAKGELAVPEITAFLRRVIETEFPEVVQGYSGEPVTPVSPSMVASPASPPRSSSAPSAAT
jgi:creatinine amidohydrolase